MSQGKSTSEIQKISSKSPPHVEFDSLRKTFGGGDIVAVDDISLEIGNDELLVIVGPSGCGKTTTLRCLAGLETPTSGRIFIDGEDVTDYSPKDRNIAFVFQETALFPHMTVRANIRFGLDMTTDKTKEEKDKQVDEVAEMMGISDMLDRQPSELSGGQQSRVGLGRAMVMNPSVFLLDEPFSALDANLRDRMQTEVKKLQRELKVSMVFVTHDQAEAMTLGDRIVIMNEGEVQQIGTPTEIYNEPVNRFVAEFIGSPSTNMLNCDLVVDKDEVYITHDLFSLTLPNDEGLSSSEGGEVTMGIRPEYLELNTENGLFDARVALIEHHGERDAVHLSADSTSLKASTKQNSVSRDQERVSMDFDRDNIWIFDQTGERIL